MKQSDYTAKLFDLVKRAGGKFFTTPQHLPDLAVGSPPGDAIAFKKAEQWYLVLTNHCDKRPIDKDAAASVVHELAHVILGNWEDETLGCAQLELLLGKQIGLKEYIKHLHTTVYTWGTSSYHSLLRTADWKAGLRVANSMIRKVAP